MCFPVWVRLRVKSTNDLGQPLCEHLSKWLDRLTRLVNTGKKEAGPGGPSLHSQGAEDEARGTQKLPFDAEAPISFHPVRVAGW